MQNTNTTEADRAETIRIFDELIADAPNADVRAARELMKAYFTNADFKSFMQEETARLNGVR